MPIVVDGQSGTVLNQQPPVAAPRLPQLEQPEAERPTGGGKAGERIRTADIHVASRRFGPPTSPENPDPPVIHPPTQLTT